MRPSLVSATEACAAACARYVYVRNGRSLGATIIHGSFSRVLIATPSNTTVDAMNYVQFILEKLKEKPLFAWIDLQPKAYWRALLWVDSANYGGVCVSPEQLEQVRDNPIRMSILYQSWAAGAGVRVALHGVRPCMMCAMRPCMVCDRSCVACELMCTRVCTLMVP